MAVRKQTMRQRAAVHERHVAGEAGAKLTRGSGSGFEKADARIRGSARIECKSTTARSFSVTWDMFDKLSAAAASHGELPFISVAFVDPAGRVLRELCITTTEVFDALDSRS